MHIHIRTSVPGIEKTLPRLFLHLLHSLSYSSRLCRRVCCPRTLTYVGGNARGGRRWSGPVGGPRSRRKREREGDGRIGRIENRRAIRETQQKDSITSYKESKPSGEINKRSPLLTMKAQKREREKTDEEENEQVGEEDAGRGRKRKKTSSAMTCVIEIPSVRSIL